MFHGNLFLSGVVDSRDKLKRDVSSSLIDLLLKNDTIRSIASTIDAPRQTLSTNEPRLGRPIMQFHCSGDSGHEVSEALPVLWQRTICTTGPFQPLQCDLTSITVIARDSFEFKKHCQLFVSTDDEPLSIAGGARLLRKTRDQSNQFEMNIPTSSQLR
jgi:hypothetical protein